MKNRQPNPASAKDKAEGSRENNLDPNKRKKNPNDEFVDKSGLDGKSDSGPEPDVFGREIPPQE